MITTSSIRAQFLDFFARNGHEIVPSSSLVPHNDPTLMFANAGMNQFKNVFTGAEKRKNSRATSSQKCVRAGGKHNDLDNVGYTARHHTFFEMLGNFSFGDYFKEKAIELAWKLLTEELKIPPEKLCVTVHPTDDEARSLWKRIAGLSDDRIINIAENIWMMGPTGPCGPNTEIFYDHGPNVAGGPPGSPEEDGDRFVEIYNLVFMQYEQIDENTRIPLPKPSVDTGMGLERLAAVLQGVTDNYDIDLFKALIAASEKLTGTRAEGDQKAAHRVIADHLRSTSFLIADGVMPSNEGRGYVLRRIMRRGMRYAHQLGCKEPLMYRLVPALIEQMGEAYPELLRAQALITETLKDEEERFKVTLERGLKLLDAESASLKKGETLSGDVAFSLYDTYGFPVDLTQDILRGRGIGLDTAGFELAMEKQKDMARAAWSGSGDKSVGKLWFDLRDKVGATAFLGYDAEEADATILAIVRGAEPVNEARTEDEVLVLLDRTPFYGESGGQIGDTGELIPGGEVIDTIKPVDNLIIHKVKVTAKSGIKVGDNIKAVINSENRKNIRANHSATHILHAVLRNLLGAHVTQKGSLVATDKLRFDISHNKALTRAELDEAEHRVNQIIWQNAPVSIEVMAPADAQKKGAMALFGEKYGDEVRVLSMGRNETGETFSMELCGGTHVHATGDIGLFKITSEGAVAAGIRRIEAVTRAKAYEFIHQQDELLRGLSQGLKTTPDKLPERVDALISERRKLEKELSEAKKSIAMGGGSGGAVQKEMIGKIAFSAKILSGVEPKDLRSLAESMLKNIGEGIAVAATDFEGKASLVVAVSQSLSARFSAVDLIKLAVDAVGGKGGGGRPEMAQGGGPDADKLEAALAAIRAKLA